MHNMRFILVLGCQRSGTTLLGQILGSQSGCIFIDEDEGAYQVADALMDYHQDTFRDILSTHIKTALYKYSDSADRLNNFHDDFQPVFILKLPNYVYKYQMLSNSFQHDIKSIFITRDVRAVAASMQNISEIPMVAHQVKHLKKNPSVAKIFTDEIKFLESNSSLHKKYATVWKLKTGLYKEFIQGPLSALMLKYEDLVLESEKTISAVLKHCGLSLENTTSHHSVLSGTAIGNTTRNRPIDSRSLNLWKKAFSEKEVEEILAIAGGLMKELDYPGVN